MANLCPICGTELRPRQKTCSPKCRVALCRRRKAPLVAVARRVLLPTLKAKQLAARRTLKAKHKQRRRELREYVTAENAAMKLELQFSDAAILAKHEQEIQATDPETLSRLVAKSDL